MIIPWEIKTGKIFRQLFNSCVDFSAGTLCCADSLYIINYSLFYHQYGKLSFSDNDIFLLQGKEVV